MRRGSCAYFGGGREVGVLRDCPRSYVVQSQHGLVPRNTHHLFKANPTANFDGNTQCVEDADHYANIVGNNSQAFVRATTPHIRTSCFGRRITHFRRFDDYV